jgi:hypothetical protein
MGTAIQFYGQKQVLEEAESRECASWAIFIGKQLYLKKESDNIDESMSFLEETIQRLSDSGSEAAYILKFYESENGPVKINEKTYCNAGSFNFKLVEPDVREQRSLGYFQQVQNKEYEKKIEVLTEELEELKAESEEKNQSLGSAFVDLVKQPEQLGMLLNVIRGVFGMPLQQYGSINNIHRAGSGEANAEATNEDTIIEMAKHIEVLEKRDPNFVKHLGMLANMEQEELNMLVSMLEMKSKK